MSSWKLTSSLVGRLIEKPSHLRLLATEALRKFVHQQQAALCDEVMEAVEDINTKLAATFFSFRRGKENAAQGAG